jgi:protein SCO1/2
MQNPHHRYRISDAAKFVGFLLLLVLSSLSFAQVPERINSGATIVEKLGDTIPGDITLRDEKGELIQLSTLMEKQPIILNLVYYRCPGICSPLMNGMIHGLDRAEMQMGKDYKVITVSFDHTEGHELAYAKQQAYFAQLKTQKATDSTWRFLTGDSVQLDRLLKSVGFGMTVMGRVPGDTTVPMINHPGVLITVSPKGKICRYLHGIDFLPFDLRMAVIEASQGRANAAVVKLLKYCYEYDEDGALGRKGGYVLSLTRIIGVVMLLVILAFFLVLVLVKRKVSTPQPTDTDVK